MLNYFYFIKFINKKFINPFDKKIIYFILQKSTSPLINANKLNTTIS